MWADINNSLIYFISDEPMYTEQPKDDFSAQNAMYIEDNEVLEDTKSENNVVEQKDANFTQKSSKISDSNVYTGKSVDANDVCVGADFDAHNSSGLRRFLLRSNQSHHVDDVTTFKSHQSATSYLDVPISTNTRLFEVKWISSASNFDTSLVIQISPLQVHPTTGIIWQSSANQIMTQL
jgi:hypothetical protein